MIRTRLRITGSFAGRAAIVAVAAVFVCALAARGDISARQAQALLKDTQDAVVTLKGVLKTKTLRNGVLSDESEDTVECTGTVVDPAGIIVASRTQIGPTSDSYTYTFGGETFKVDTSSQAVSLNILMPDGREIPARVVSSDPDLNLSIVVPENSADFRGKPFHAIPLKSPARPAVSDGILVVGRTDECFQRQPQIDCDFIAAVIAKPRPFYTPQSPWAVCSGLPVFTENGQLLGIGSTCSGLTCIVPAGDVRSLVEQARKLLAKPASRPATTVSSSKPQKDSL